jgi:hypothetical protein
MRLLEKLTDPHDCRDRLTPLSGDYGLEIGPVADVPAEGDNDSGSSWRIPNITALEPFTSKL